MELLARTETRIDDVTAQMCALAAEPEQVLGQLQDRDRPTHLQHGDAAPDLGKKRGLESQLYLLRDRHEEVGDVLVCDRERLTRLHWLLKSGITLPLLPKTLPKRTAPKAVFEYESFR
jgi:hypothetical protein